LVVLKPVANKVGLLDHPGGRKTHKQSTPLIGGLGIYLGTLFITFFTPEVLNHYGPLIALASLVLTIGLLDDLRGLPVSTRMGIHTLAALLMCVVAGNQLYSFGDLFGTGEIPLGLLSIPVTVFATVGVINAVNMSDGMDGLSGGMAVIALFFLGVVAWLEGNYITLTFSAILICSLLAFLALNFRLPWKKHAMIYLGDAGSTFLGFVLAWMFVESSQGTEAIIPPSLALWFLAVPLMDAVYLLISRPLQGKSPFASGSDHLHHKLAGMGLSNKTVVFILYALSFILGSAALALYIQGFAEVVLFMVFLVLFVVYALIVHYSPLITAAIRKSV